MQTFFENIYPLALSQLKIGTIALSTVVFLSACIGTPKVSKDEKLSQYLTTGQISENIEIMKGKTVSVRNDVEELIEKTAFTLDKDQLFGGETILVIDVSQESVRPLYKKGMEVLVKGKVEQFFLAQIKQKYNLELDSSIYRKYEGKPTIIAQSVLPSPDPGDVTSEPQIYYNKLLAIEGEVEDIVTPGIFELDEEQVFGGEDLLVIAIKPNNKIQEDENVVVTGVLRPFVMAEFERDYKLNWDLSVKKEIEAEYSNKPVFVAQEVERVSE